MSRHPKNKSKFYKKNNESDDSSDFSECCSDGSDELDNIEENMHDPGDFNYFKTERPPNAETNSTTLTKEDSETENVLDPVVYLKWLTKICIYVFKLSQKARGKTNRNHVNPIMQMAMNFNTVINSPEADYDDYIEQFFRIYQNNSKSILDNEDKWLTKNDIVITSPYYVGKNKKIFIKKKNQKIARVNMATLYLSTIYNMAGDLYKNHCNDTVPQGSKRNEYLYYPTRIIRALYLTFTETIDSGIHLQRLGELLDEADKQLGIVDRNIEEDFEIRTDFMSGFFKGGFKQVLSLIMKAMTNKMGFDDVKGKDGKNINLDKIIEAMENLLSGKECMGFQKSFVEDLLKKAQNNPTKLPQLILEALQNEELLNYISQFTGQEFNKETVTEIIKEKGEEINKIFNETINTAKKTGILNNNFNFDEAEETESPSTQDCEPGEKYYVDVLNFKKGNDVDEEEIENVNVIVTSFDNSCMGSTSIVDIEENQ